MLRPWIIDLETSLGNPKLFGPDSKDPDNDFYTYITGDHPDNVQIYHSEQGFARKIPEAVRSYFNTHNLLVGHNLPFDLGYLYHTPEFSSYIASGGTVWDTALAEYLITGQVHKFPSLAELQQKYLGEKIKEDRISKLFKSGISPRDILQGRIRAKRVFRLYETYCRGDGTSTLQVFAQQYRRAQKLGMLPIIKMHQRALLAVVMMQKTGIQIDLIKCEKTLRDFRLKSIEYLKKSTEITKKYWPTELGEFNVNSPKQKSALLFGGQFIVKDKVKDGSYKNGNPKYRTVDRLVRVAGFGLSTDFTRRSASGYATDEKVINTIYKKSANSEAKEYCRLQKEAMRYTKMASTYLEPFLNYSVDGRLYPKYNMTKTVTSRFSSEQPNAQNIPSKGEMLQPIQGQLVAPEGWLCCEIDFEMLEIYVVAFLSQDQALINDLRMGVDFHCLRLGWIPRLAEGKTYEEIVYLCKVLKDPVWTEKRSKAKNISYKKAYGGGAKSLAEAEELEVSDVQALFDQEDITYSGVKEFNGQVMSIVQSNKRTARQIDYGREEQKARKFYMGLELLPLINRAAQDKQYRNDYTRSHGIYSACTGKRYAFAEYGDINFKGQIKRQFSTTETKNYQIQGTAHDVVAMAMAECMDYVLENQEEVEMIMQIHDSLRFYIKKGTEHLHIPKLCSIMSSTPYHFKKYLNIGMDLIMPVEAKTGENFAETEVYKAN